MSLRTQVEGLNKLLTAIYGKDTHLSTLLKDLGFSPQQIEILRRQHAQQVVESYIALLKERIVADSDGERLYEIIKHRFGLDGEQPQTLQSLGERFGISRERVRQLEQKALKRCRTRSRLKSWEVGLYDIAYSLLDTSDALFLRERQSLDASTPLEIAFLGCFVSPRKAISRGVEASFGNTRKWSI